MVNKITTLTAVCHSKKKKVPDHGFISFLIYSSKTWHCTRDLNKKLKMCAKRNREKNFGCYMERQPVSIMDEGIDCS